MLDAEPALFPPAVANPPANRVAFVCGVGRYWFEPPHDNTPTDACGVAMMLSQLGYGLTVVIDPTRAELLRKFSEFAEHARDAEVAVVCIFAGGMVADGVTLISPVDCNPSGPHDALDHVVALPRLLAEMRGMGAPIIVIVDTCRMVIGAEGTFDAEGNMVHKTGVGIDVQREDIGPAGPTNVIISYACADNTIAFDGTPGGHGPYGYALLRQLSAERTFQSRNATGLDWESLLGRVKLDVMSLTGGKQIPSIDNFLAGPVLVRRKPTLAADTGRAH